MASSKEIISYTTPFAGQAHSHPQPIKPDIGRSLLRWKWIIAFCFFAGIAGGVASVVLQRSTYRATATVEVVGFNEAFFGMNQFDPQAGTGSYGPSAANMQTQLRVIASATLLRRAAERVSLEVTPEIPAEHGTFAKLRSLAGLNETEPVQFMHSAIQQAVGSLRARPLGSSRLIEISCEAPSAEIATVFANAVASEFIAQNSQFRSSNAVRTAQWIEGQAEEAKNRLEQAETKLRDFTREAGIAFVVDESTLATSKLKQLQGDLSAIQADRIAKQTRYEIARSSPVDSVPEILDDGTIKALRTTITDLKREIAAAQTTLTPEHTKVKRLAAQIAELETAIRTEKANLVKRLQNEYEAALRQEKLLSGAYGSQSRAVASQAGQGNDYALLKRDVESARQTYNKLVEQLNQATLTSAIPTNNVRVVDPAISPTAPFKPVPGRDVAAYGAAGLFLPVSLICGWEILRARRLSRYIGSPGTTSAMLSVPELAVIPAIEAPKRRGLLRLGKADKQDEYVVIHGRTSMLAESFRYALASMLRAGGESTHPMFVITSPGPGEGKTTLVSNLAIAMAETGQRVLLIDADLRRPRLHDVFKLDQAAGLSDLLRGGDTADARSMIMDTGVKGLSLLQAGVAKASEAMQMLFSPKLGDMLQRLQKEYDAVLIDTAPALYFPDARLIGRYSDGVLLVLRSGVTSHETAVTTREVFAHDSIPVLGSILNDWTPNDSAQRMAYYHYSDAQRPSPKGWL